MGGVQSGFQWQCAAPALAERLHEFLIEACLRSRHTRLIARQPKRLPQSPRHRVRADQKWRPWNSCVSWGVRYRTAWRLKHQIMQAMTERAEACQLAGFVQLDDAPLGVLGIGADVKDAIRQRGDFLAKQGVAEHRGQRIVLARNLRATLRGRKLIQAGKDIADETGLEPWPVADGQRMAGIYRRSVMLDDGMGFSLVPWKLVVEQRSGKQVAAAEASWELGRPRGLPLDQMESCHEAGDILTVWTLIYRILS